MNKMEYYCKACMAKWYGLSGQVYCVQCGQIILKDVNKWQR